jgi:hypothetical protein
VRVIPPAIPSPVDHIEAPPGFEGVDVCAYPPPRPVILPPAADDRAALVRADLADTARRLGLRCTARLVLVAATEEEWKDVRHDLKGAAGWCRWDDRGMATSGARAAALMGDGEVAGAAWELADHIGESVDTWETMVRREREKGGGR